MKTNTELNALVMAFEKAEEEKRQERVRDIAEAIMAKVEKNARNGCRTTIEWVENGESVADYIRDKTGCEVEYSLEGRIIIKVVG